MNKLMMTVFVAVMLMSTAGFARNQPANTNAFNWDYFGLPALDEAQKAKLDKIRIKYVSELVPIRYQLRAGEMTLRVLMTVVPIDQAAYKARVDELAGMLKAMSAIEVRLIADVSGVLKDGAQKNELFVRVLTPDLMLTNLFDGLDDEQGGREPEGQTGMDRPVDTQPGVAIEGQSNQGKQDRSDRKSDKEVQGKSCGCDSRGPEVAGQTASCSAPKK